MILSDNVTGYTETLNVVTSANILHICQYPGTVLLARCGEWI